MAHVSVVFNYNNKKNKSGEYQVSIRVYIKGKTKYFPTGVKVHKKDWSDKMKRVKPSCDQAVKYNHLIDRTVSVMKDRLALFQINHHAMSMDKLAESFKYQSASSFNEYVHCYMHGPWKRKTNTRKKYATFMRYLDEFNPSVSFADLNEHFFHEFEHWLVTVKKNVKSTVDKNVEPMKVILKDAVKQGIINRYPFQYVQSSIKYARGRPKIILNMIELNQIINAELINARLIDTRKKFLFMCYTGMNYSDLKALPWTWITEQRVDWISFGKKDQVLRGYRAKNGNSYLVPLHQYSLSILENQKGEDDTLIFPDCIKDSKFNLSLKKLAAASGLSKNITATTGRKTFITYMIAHSVSKDIIRKMVGHIDDRALRSYYELDYFEIIEQISNKKLPWFE